MSMIAPPNQQPRTPRSTPALTLKAWLVREWQHWRYMPWLHFCLLALPSLILLYIDPLLPIAAYGLQLWASSSWAWRDRWASIWTLARHGGALVAFTLLYTTLSYTNVWIFPNLTTDVQAFWITHVPGDLSLSPLDGRSLLAHTLVLLPLAPILALIYERIDPRTHIQLQRKLTPADLVEPKTPKTTQTTTAPSPPPAHAKATMPQRTRKSTRATQQLTIDSILAEDKTQTTPTTPSRQPKKKQPASTIETHPPTPKSINWQDVAE